MISEKELLDLLGDLESAQVERTVSVNNTEKFCQAICAFANDYQSTEKPGYLIVGADDKTGEIKDIPITDELLRNLGAIRSDGNVSPPPAIAVEKISFSEGELAVVEVKSSTLPPVRYKGRIWIRVGPRKAIASEQEERILSERRSSLILTFDAQPVTESQIEDMSMRLFEEYRLNTIDPETMAANHRTQEEKLASLRFYDLKRRAPTVAGLLTFGTNVRFFLPGAYVQFLRFDRNDMSEMPKDEAVISGDLKSVVDTIFMKIRAYNIVSLSPGERFQDRPSSPYPEWALRELFHNALIHRDYNSTAPVRFYWFEDRIEIQNPGGLFGEVTRQTLTKRNSYRNPIIAEVMKSMGYVNKYGYGIQRAMSLLKENGNPEPKFDIDDRIFCVTIGRHL
jgi:ATP-dependent DNA helicase RecG